MDERLDGERVAEQAFAARREPEHVAGVASRTSSACPPTCGITSVTGWSGAGCGRGGGDLPAARDATAASPNRRRCSTSASRSSSRGARPYTIENARATTCGRLLRRRLAGDPPCQRRGPLQRPLAVHHQQRLRRAGRAVAVADGAEGVGQVERVEQRVARVAQQLREDAPPRRGVVGRRAAGAVELQLAAGGQHRVAHLLGVEPARVHPPQPAVLRVLRASRPPAPRGRRPAGTSPRS